MFPRVLLSTDELYLSADWFGMGRLLAMDVATGQAAIASPGMKTYFLETFEALERKGIRIGPDSPAALHSLRVFARLILNEQSLQTRAALSQSPSELAEILIRMAFAD